MINSLRAMVDNGWIKLEAGGPGSGRRPGYGTKRDDDQRYAKYAKSDAKHVQNMIDHAKAGRWHMALNSMEKIENPSTYSKGIRQATGKSTEQAGYSHMHNMAQKMYPKWYEKNYGGEPDEDY